ncbi:MAG: hypothetical protein AAF624_10095 [Bacteroidota bacterium]
MPIPLKRLNALRTGRSLAAEVPASEPGRRAFVVIVPQCPTPREQPDAWLYTDRHYQTQPTRVLRSPSFITGFDILRIEHDAKYTYRAWGWDADVAWADATTRAKRVFVAAEDEIEAALAPWLNDVEKLGPPQDDSVLVNCPHPGTPGEYPHLWT